MKNNFLNEASRVAINEALNKQKLSLTDSFKKKDVMTDEILCDFIAVALDLQYPQASNLVDFVTEISPRTNHVYGYFLPLADLTPADHDRAMDIINDFINEIDMMAFDHDVLTICEPRSIIRFENKLSIITMMVEYLRSKNVPVIDMTKVEYDVNAITPEQHLENIKASHSAAMENLKNDSHYNQRLMIYSAMRVYDDLSTYAGISQNMRDVFLAKSGDDHIADTALCLSNARTLIEERIKLENKNNQSVSNGVGKPSYLIN